MFAPRPPTKDTSGFFRRSLLFAPIFPPRDANSLLHHSFIIIHSCWGSSVVELWSEEPGVASSILAPSTLRRFTPQGKLSSPLRVNESMDCFVYIAQCSDGTYYTGITWNLEKRISEHNQGIKTSIQPSRRPVQLVYSEWFNTRVGAAKREKEIKGWRREKKEKLINSSLH